MKYSREQRAQQRRQGQATTPNPPPASEDNNTATTNITTTDPIFFWREYEEPNGYLSQWYPSPFQDPKTHPTHVFTCAEQYMMYRKALVLARTTDSQPTPQPPPTTTTNTTTQQKEGRKTHLPNTQAPQDRARLPAQILASRDPGAQKSLARSHPFTPSQFKEWEATKFDVVLQGTYCKFSQNPDLRARLLATGARELVEASPGDRVWGVGFAAEFAEMRRGNGAGFPEVGQ
ncbi:hypothetical protein B0A55_02516 [Friedmanniomyces simplex]|uniref:NADAR domain-containing protein n=1 Tax=Friedmanniomyces simplex TaxID=329884 RepID=A0A4U0XUA4_9PEZI|nr:hypothetical protein B0A55_02516 [Friedmanniomyces simplex]